MLTLVSYMQAHDDEQNLHRFYRIEYGQDLFDQWIVEINYGFAHEAYFKCPGYWDNNLNWHEESFNATHWMIDLFVNNN